MPSTTGRKNRAKGQQRGNGQLMCSLHISEIPHAPLQHPKWGEIEQCRRLVALFQFLRGREVNTKFEEGPSGALKGLQSFTVCTRARRQVWGWPRCTPHKVCSEFTSRTGGTVWRENPRGPGWPDESLRPAGRRCCRGAGNPGPAAAGIATSLAATRRQTRPRHFRPC